MMMRPPRKPRVGEATIATRVFAQPRPLDDSHSGGGDPGPDQSAD